MKFITLRHHNSDCTGKGNDKKTSDKKKSHRVYTIVKSENESEKLETFLL